MDTNEDQKFIALLYRPIKEEDAAKRYIEFLHYSKIEDAYYEASDDEDHPGFQVYVKDTDQTEARKLYRAFKAGEEERRKAAGGEEAEKEAELEEEEEKEVDAEEKDVVYEKKEDQYHNFRSSAYTFFFVGALGVVFVILALTKVLPIFSGLLPTITLGLLSVIFLIVGVTSYRRSQEIRDEVSDEEEQIKTINEWMDQNIDESVLSGFEQNGDPDELVLINKISYIGDRLKEQFEDVDPALLEEQAEEYYNSHFEQTE